MALLLIASPVTGQVMEKMFQPGSIRVLIVSGRNNHDWRTTTPYLRQILDATGRFDVRVTEEPAGLDAAALAPYHALVLDYNGPRWGATAENAVESFVSKGKGAVALHAAAYAFGRNVVLGDKHMGTGVVEPEWPAYAKMLGGWWSGEEPRTGHGARHVFRVKWTDRDHPIAAGLDDSFLISDELYHSLRTQPGIRLLATAYDDPKQKGTGKEEPLIWALSYGQGRVVYSALGHDTAAMQSPGFVTSFARSVEWAATGKVELPPTVSVYPRDPKAVRAMVVTGGHEYDPSLDAMFDGAKDVRVSVNPHPTAFRPDLLKRYDVLVFYDLVQTVPEEQKQRLVQFAESGKGLVILHHAVADFNDWEWWWKELVGAKYFLEPAAERPRSTFKHDVYIATETVARHAVTKGIPPMHILDETYKGMWFSPDIQVLIRTDAPTADGPLVWISPYRKSRVAVIQLGHGSEGHRHPHFRQLVMNAIRWAGGRAEEPPPSQSAGLR